MKEFINSYFSRLSESLEQLNIEELQQFVKVLTTARKNGNHIFIMGNGGSAATASHYVCDLNKGCKNDTDKHFKVICLNDNTPAMMAYANDMSYDDVFVEQMKNFFEKGDVVIGISGSGNSKNVLKAIEYANENGGITVGLTGFSGGKLKEIATYSVNANIDDMQISEDIHMILCHLIMQLFTKTNITKVIE